MPGSWHTFLKSLTLSRLFSTTRRNKTLVKELSTPPPGSNDLWFPSEYSQSTLEQFKSCLWKQWWTYWRSPDYNLVRFFFTFACALMLGTIFWKIGQKRWFFTGQSSTALNSPKAHPSDAHYSTRSCRSNSTDLLTIIGAMYAAVLFVGINNCSTVQPIVAIERTVFYRERAAGMYSALPYAIAQVDKSTLLATCILFLDCIGSTSCWFSSGVTKCW